MVKDQNDCNRATSIVEPVDFSDDESTPLTAQEQYTKGQRTIPETKGWDLFRDPPPKADSGSMTEQKCLEITTKIIKIIVYLLVFSIVLCSTVIANSTILFMTSQLRVNKTISYCNQLLGRTRTFVVTLPEEERIAWVWFVILAFAIPELGTLTRSIRICVFKSWKRPRMDHFMFVFFMESFYTVGLAIMFISVLPDLDVIQGAMLFSCVCFVPGLLGLLSRNAERDGSKRFLFYLIDIAALAAQATSFVLWPLIYNKDQSLWMIPLALILISCRWWENYVSIQNSFCLMKYLGRIKEDMKLTRYIIYTFVTVWKIAAFIISCAIILYLKGNAINYLFNELGSVFTSRNITVAEIQATIGSDTTPDLSDVNPTGMTTIVTTSIMTPIYIMLLQTCSAWLAYVFGKFACKILIQAFSYALPINLSIPVTISLLIAICGLRSGNPCYFRGIIPDYLFFESPPFTSLEDLLLNEYAWVWLLWLLSQTWITIHIWTPKCERLATTEKLFTAPMYDGMLISQSMGLNRQRDDAPDRPMNNSTRSKNEKNHDEADVIYGQNDALTAPSSFVRDTDYVTRIYVCATMWHETKDEMIEFLKSILRLDEDQCARKNAQNYLKVIDPDYYELETHIFFDDAFEISDHDENESQVNRFVKLLVETLDEAASKVHQTNMHVNAPKKYPTPYGGRLVWTLPGKTKMIAHLKDKSKIRHRKRWSQVMYMYYLLGHRLMQLPISIDRKEVVAENTYLLALDGDIDFQPIAVTLLIDLMKKNKNLGAACGRIHPVGSGPMVWYQMFEYAIGHWLQKATEHMIGCVLCSPGCFSLFRGKALMDDRVMRKYTTRSHEARHYVQYDQGEDRWLCTLLLQRGYRVEYSAASDAYTHAPEGFNEFYNQRRRWVPSTMANIMDLITDSKNTIKNNDNISLMYMCYQILLMIGTILGPGTIFLMITGAVAAAFELANWTSFYYNLIPILIFMTVCFTCKSDVQLFFAAVISILYGLVMMAVIVAILIQMVDDGWIAPTSLFLYLVSGQLIIAGLMHPQELMCLPCGIVYYVTIPSMYLLLVIYSITNLNNVAWGTREVQVKKTMAELEEEKKEAEAAKRKAKKNSLFGFLQNDSGTNNDDQGSIEISLAGLFRCILCTHSKPSEDKQQLKAIAESLEQLGKRLESIEKAVDPQAHNSGRRRVSFSGSHPVDPLNSMGQKPSNKARDDSDSESTMSQNTETGQDRTFLVSPYWLEDEDLKKGEVDFLSPLEEQFWKDILEKYLYPIDEDKVEKKRIAGDLKDLRDRSVFAFFMLNALFVLIVFLMQLNKDELHIRWPFGGDANVTFDETNLEVHISTGYLQLEPIGLVFVFSFALILLIQFIAMLMHRFGTFAHILANTTLGWYCCKKPEDFSEQALLSKDAVEIVKDLQRLDGIEDDYEMESTNRPGRRDTIRNLEKSRRKTSTINNLDLAFRERFFSMAEGSALPRRVSARKSTHAFKAFEARRHSVLAERRQSQMQMSSGGNNTYGVNRISLGVQPRKARTSQSSLKQIPESRTGGIVNLAFDPEETQRV